MTDRELLELAAKAAGMRIRCSDGGSFSRDAGEYWRAWNPLKDDGDALRLAVTLGMWLYIGKPDDGFAITSIQMPEFDNIEQHGDDPCAATRRAIVRAAAESQRWRDSDCDQRNDRRCV